MQSIAKKPSQPVPIIAPTLSTRKRPRACGRFLFSGEEKLRICGVTYGTFRPDEAGNDFEPAKAASDFAKMASNGINAIRTYTVPPVWLLDLALQYDLWVMVGIPWEQHITFLENRACERAIEERLRGAVRSCANHPSVLCFAIGNEIPSTIVRWYGHRRIEKFLERLYRLAKAEDPEALVTYVNYPTTEYLTLPFLDLVCFNVYLESQNSWERYLARLHNLAGERPLILSEVGLDSRRNGEDRQAQSLDWLIRTAFTSGGAGIFVFAWTDEWYRGGFEIEDWDFGLTRRDGTEKVALDIVRRTFTETPFCAERNWPLISVVVCSYNGHRTLRECLAGISKVEYPNFEVIVIDDGSSPPLEPIVAQYGFRAIRTPNQGLSAARNLGMQAAKGEIVAYIDDDAYPDPDWLTYLADSFLKTTHVGIGGPNIAPPGDGRIADCVANAPGGPVHVLLSDDTAEHIPGCNMAFRKAALQAIGGFDPQFRVAGDDVDLCWRLQRQGETLGFHPAAMVWHHRRNSVRAYWRQQKGYGCAEALLERKWPEKYNSAGHSSWTGRIYGKGLIRGVAQISRIYHGTWGAAPFQSLYQGEPHTILSALLMPEWYLIVLFLGLAILLCHEYERFWVAAPLFLLALAIPVVQAWRSAARATFPSVRSISERLALRLFTATLYMVQPIARLWGRAQYGLFPWRKRATGFCAPRRKQYRIWSETWQAPTQWLEAVEKTFRSTGGLPVRGGHFDLWDFELPGGIFGASRLRMAVEEHGAGRQLVRFRCWPRPTPVVLALLVLFGAAAIDAEISHLSLAAAFLATVAALLAAHLVQHCGAAMAVADAGLKQFAVQHRLEMIKEKQIAPPRVAWDQPPQFAAGLHLNRLQRSTVDVIGSNSGDD